MEGGGVMGREGKKRIWQGEAERETEGKGRGCAPPETEVSLHH